MNIILVIIILIIFILIYRCICKYVYNDLELFSNNTLYVDKVDYDIIEIQNFLTNEECDKIIELSKGNMFSSKVYSQNEDLYDNKTRISQQCWLNDNDVDWMMMMLFVFVLLLIVNIHKHYVYDVVYE